MTDPKESSNKIVNAHLLISAFIAVVIFVFKQRFFAYSFIAGSITMNIYLRLLQNAFWLAWAAKFQFKIENKTLLVILSALRSLLVAAAFTYFILKLKFSLIALGLSFICYNIIVIAGAIFFTPACKSEK